MVCGMFGKLPSKRDFIAYNMPRPFLDAWETWLQAGVAESKLALNDRWQEMFLGVPIWRFLHLREAACVLVLGQRAVFSKYLAVYHQEYRPACEATSLRIPRAIV